MTLPYLPFGEPRGSAPAGTEGATAAEVFVEKLGQALHAFGTPAHRLEEALGRVAATLGLEGQFFSTPTAIFASLGRCGERKTLLVRVEPGDVHLEKLRRLDGVLAGVVSGDLEPAEAAGRIDEIVATPGRYGPWLSTLSFALASGSAARFFGGGWREVAAALAGGLVVGLWALVAARFRETGRLFEPVGGLLMALATAASATVLSPLAPQVVTVAGLIVLVPGMTLTVAMTELATRNLVSGSARLAGAMLVFLTIGFGVALGGRLGGWLFGAPAASVPQALPAWTEAVALVVVALAFTVLFRAHPRDAGWILAAGAVALLGGRLGAGLLGPQLGALLAAVMVGAGSNLLARYTDRPAAVTQLPGLMLLVPGSIGFRGISSFLEADVVSGIGSAFEMALVAIALVTGLLMANVLVPPNRIL